jgi:hypothetical protein
LAYFNYSFILDRYAPNAVGAKKSFNQSMAYLLNAKAALEGDDPNNILVSEIGLVDIIEGLIYSRRLRTLS